MRFIPFAGLLLSMCQGVAVLAQDRHAAPGERGTYVGSGRACGGQLKITRDRISWKTPFSQCAVSPFMVKERELANGELRVTYRLLRPSAECRYRVLLLSHDGSDASIGWNVVGYESVAAYDAAKRGTGLSCYLYK